MNKNFKLGIFIVLGALLSACTTYKQAHHEIEATVTKIHAAHDSQNKLSPPVITKPGYYIDPNTVTLNHDPAWLRKQVSLKTKEIPLNILLNRLVRLHAVTINFDPNLNPHQLASLNYSGSIKGALNTLAASTDTTYSIEPNQLHWQEFETKTFDISFMPGTSNYLVGQNQGENAANSYNSKSPANQLNDQQFSNLQAQLSLWGDLRKTINQLKSNKGHVVISEATTTVTVSDKPSRVAAIKHYIDEINRRLNQQVALKVQVLEVTLNKDFNYGIDWNLVTRGLGTIFRIVGNAGNATNLIKDNLITNSSNSALSRIGIGSNGMDVFINALNQQGKVRVVTEPEVVTMNNQIASIRITQSVGYIESVSQTSSQYFSTSAINPGSITDGFTLYVLPKIQDNKVYLQLSSTIASLERLEKVSNIPSNTSSGSSAQYQAIQVPTLAQKSFNQRSLVQNGSTLILAGYKRLHDATSDASFFGIKPLGGKGATSSNVETLVLITPTILHSSQSNGDNNSKR